ncbi:MAG: nucleotidyltransferase family protein [Terracidiphilus sp.]
MRVKVQIAELLLAGDERATAAAGRIAEAEAWHAVLALAGAWKVTPQLSAQVQKLGLKLSSEDTWTIRREFLRAHGDSALRAAKAIAAIGALEQAGIRVTAFKGVAAMALLYGGPKQRTIGDGDLLIQRKDLGDALTCLEGEGLARKGTETLAQYLKFVENAPRFAGNEAIALYGADGSEIDVHWQLAGSGLRVEEILERSVRADLMGSEIPVVDAKDGFLLTVHHAIREDMGIESMCRDLVDARVWCAHMELAGQLEEGMRWVYRSRIRVAALAVTSLLRGYDDTTAAAQAAELLSDSAKRAERRAAARLVELFHYQLGNGRLGKDVMYLVHWRPWRQILKGLGGDWAGYRRSMESMEEQLGEQQALHKRLAELARSIPGLQGLRLARALAVVKYRGN